MLKIIKEHKIGTQEELKGALKKYGFSITQSSLSRDIAELGIMKQHGYYVIPPRGMRDSLPPITSIESAGPSLIVVKTLVGMAAPVGIAIDNQKISEIIGTVAGDDTVFVATGQGASHDGLKKTIRKLFKGG